ncbi:histidine--tRNA ligase [Candidatus Nomurabacteria bacterium]|nr:histidine--tRNA ligase [Candidatus Nomurabacteria bacterium]
MKKTKTTKSVKAPKKKNLGEASIQIPKGMRDFFDSESYHLQGFAEKAAEIATYYGFRPIETPIMEQTNLFTRAVGEATDIVEKEIYTLRTKGGDQLALRPELTAPIMRAYFELGLQSEPQPILLYSYGPVFRHDKPQRGRYREFRQFDMEAIGTSKAVADAMIIKVTMLILNEAGFENLRLELNSLGDKDCRQNYRRELINYYKKHLRDVCTDCRERFKTNPLRLLDCKNPECQPIKSGAPSSISFLCHDCQKHFQEVLEYLEMMGLAYEINNNLVRGLDYYSRTVFEITEAAPPDNPDNSPILTLAAGGRYDYLARAIGNKKDVPAVGVAIGVDRLSVSPNYKPLNPRIIKKPKIFFIQLSFDAKLKSFAVIETLRKAKIPVAQSLSKDSLGAQLAIAERLAVPLTIILGQKEAMEGTVIVRNMQNRSQETVKIADLAEHIKSC